MKKILLFCFGLVLIINNLAFAQSGVTANASTVTTGVNSTTTYVNITFPYNTRNLFIENNDATAYVFIDTKSDTNTVNKSSCYLLGPGDDLTLYDFITGGISILYDNAYSTDTEASPISIIATY